MKSDSDHPATPVVRRINVDRDGSSSTPTTVGGASGGGGGGDGHTTPVIRLSSYQSDDVSPSSASRRQQQSPKATESGQPISGSSSHTPPRRSSSPPILDLTGSSADPLEVARELLASESALRRLHQKAYRAEDSEQQVLGRQGGGASATKPPLLYKLTGMLQRRLPTCGLSDDAMARAHACASVSAAVRERRGSGVWAPGGGPMRSGGDTVVNQDVLLDTVIYALCFTKVRVVHLIH